ncbi:MAG: hypothetical protein KC464_19165, partial [Myxococcales bacterium]|nr:hypothetical protein [Myxococcales bacterium]
MKHIHHIALLALAAATSLVVGACEDPGGGYTDARPGDDGGHRDAGIEIDAELDTTAPETTITVSPDALVNTATVTLEFTADEPATFECSIDSGAYATCTSPYAATVPDGGHAFAVRATDAAGNTDATPAEATWESDTLAPDTTITAAPPALDNSTDVSFEFTADEAATYACDLDGAGFVACTSPHALTALADGAHTFSVRATDAAGNTDATPASHAWTIDSSTPDTVIDTGPSGLVAATSATFEFSSPDAGAGATFECHLDAAAFATCTSPISYAALAQGSHTFEVRVRDMVGNLDPTPATRTWTVDTVAPDTTITSAPAALTASGAASFEFAANEAGSTFQCRLDGGAWAACTSPQAYASLADGGHTFDVRAVDPAGNTDGSPATHAWTIDSAAPDTTITAAPSSPTNVAAPSFSFTATQAGSTFQCRLDGGAWAACVSPQAYAAQA